MRTTATARVAVTPGGPARWARREEPGTDQPDATMDDEHSNGRRADEPPDDERRHQRDSGAGLLLGAVVLAVLMVAYIYVH